MGYGLSEAAATLLRVRVVLMLTFVREPAVMSELARYIAQSPRLIRLGLGLDEAHVERHVCSLLLIFADDAVAAVAADEAHWHAAERAARPTATVTKSKKRAPVGSSLSTRSDL